ncbi:MAG: 3-ketoacyl-ACP reductase [Zetaproteobacteria bacterium]|nr:3-ketoacyl-ACP reductase [Pseudobdellovibrionaceae bacterium]
MNGSVWITGAGGGLGLELVSYFIGTGQYLVYATDIDQSALDQLHQRFRDNGRDGGQRLLTQRLDVSDRVEWKKAREKLISESAQPLTIMINNAGYLQPGYIADCEDEQVDRHIDCNVKGLIWGCRMAVQMMETYGAGQIINICSLAGIAPVAGIGLYTASKFAVRGFSLALAQEVRDSNIFVSVVCPDVIETPMYVKQIKYKEAAMSFSGSRVLQPKEVVNQIIRQALKKKKLMVCVPRSRGWLALLPNLWPDGYMMILARWLGAKGEKKRRLLASE